MGCDIHGVFQKKTSEGWEDVETEYEFNRHYYLFATLAGVRNGRGFAGIPTHSPVVPISEPRGVPDDMEIYNDEYGGNFMGDHSHSWLTGQEILAREHTESVWFTGIVSLELFKSWDGISEPEYYSGGIWGNDVVIADSPVAVNELTTHVRVYWKEKPELSYFFDEVKRLVSLHGEIRFVFGFDS